MSEALLDVRGLTIAFGRAAAAQTVVADATFSVGPGEVLAIVGESGSGKSVTALALLGLLPRGSAHIAAGKALFEGQDLLQVDDEALRRVRGRRIGMVFQEPMTSLNPVLTIGRQMTEALVQHRRMHQQEARGRAAAMLDRAGLDRPAERLRQYPHELSGGMRQRVMIAMAMLLDPALLIADEPTTALDVTVQAQILDLMRIMTRAAGASLVLITHDMGVVAEMADRVVVMQRGRIVEQGGVVPLFDAPRAPYTRQLLAAVPRHDAMPLVRDAPSIEPPILRIENAAKRFAGGQLFARRGVVQALDRVSLSLFAGETLALVGESGSGKSTLGRAAACLLHLDAGGIMLGGIDIASARGRALRKVRRRIQIVFQDPFASLDPTFTVGRTVAEPLVIHGFARGRAAAQRASELLHRVGLERGLASRYPHELSGGQRQRVAIARALAVQPDLIIADEPTSALDVSTQADVLQLLLDLQQERGLAFLLITHDLAVVRKIAHRIAVMRAGRILEEGPAAMVLGHPRHPYTQALLAAAPDPDPRARGRPRPVPPPITLQVSELVEVAPGHRVAA